MCKKDVKMIQISLSSVKNKCSESGSNKREFLDEEGLRSPSVRHGESWCKGFIYRIMGFMINCS